ncbi:hypothetical protein H5410_059830 [Solanum commersonii]|uniref:RING-type E3 ubiquitin transferase n=1 Tax=Solanum commersonii TaxID=4109 RepID=A0A9J5W456_SOLCO|nr:hypothetical protein H5410_059830 [Solanum commersonii]
MSHDQQGPPTILPDDETINNNVDTNRVPMRIIHTTAIVPAQPIVNEVDDDEENYSEFSDNDDDDDEDDEEDVDVDVSEYSKTRTYHVPTMDISGDDDVIVEEQEACAICLIEYNDEDTIGTLQCGHEFHVECIKKWLMRKKTCPFCRAQLLPTHEKTSSS